MKSPETQVTDVLHGIMRALCDRTSASANVVAVAAWRRERMTLLDFPLWLRATHFLNLLFSAEILT
ncbi:MAG: hypothetical protein ABI035_10345 [Gemmatimonadaceae bacterium]